LETESIRGWQIASRPERLFEKVKKLSEIDGFG
jgi:hypothetical protein